MPVFLKDYPKFYDSPLYTAKYNSAAVASWKILFTLLIKVPYSWLNF